MSWNEFGIIRSIDARSQWFSENGISRYGSYGTPPQPARGKVVNFSAAAGVTACATRLVQPRQVAEKSMRRLFENDGLSHRARE